MGIIRFIFSLSVIANHCGALWKFDLVGGEMAVQAFYMISGFFMSMVLNEKYINKNKSYKLFITNRLMKLYPTYWVIVLIVIILSVAWGVSNGGKDYFLLDYYHKYKLAPQSLIFLIFSNIFLLGQDIVMFLGLNTNSGSLFFTPDFRLQSPQLHHFLLLSPAWFLPLEIIFYLIAPFLLKRKTKVIVGLILLSFLLRLYLYNALQLKNDPWTYRFFPTELMFFLIGSLSYRQYRNRKEKEIKKIHCYIAFALVIICTVIYFKIPEITFKYFPFSARQIVYFLVFSISMPFIFVLFKKNRFDRKIGNLSYPIYLSHWFIIAVCQAWISRWSSISFFQSSIFIAILSIIFSLLLNKYAIDPIEKMRQARVNK